MKENLTTIDENIDLAPHEKTDESDVYDHKESIYVLLKQAQH